MKITTWLDALSASFPRHEMSDLQSREYLQELKTWVLTDDQWIAVKSLAKRRYTFFPSISELEAIMQEVRRDRVPGSGNGAVGWELFTHTDGRVYARRPQVKS
jgi:hypothetical protein